MGMQQASDGVTFCWVGMADSAKTRIENMDFSLGGGKFMDSLLPRRRLSALMILRLMFFHGINDLALINHWVCLEKAVHEISTQRLFYCGGSDYFCCQPVELFAPK